jgi:hypothetical protein
VASWLVLDWDHDQFHVLCAQSSRRGVQVTRAVTWAHPEPFTPSTAERVGKALRDFLKSAKIAPAPVIVGIGRDRIFLKELRFPAIAAHEEASLVRFQTGKEMAEAVDNYAIDYAALHNGGGAERQIMTVAARRDIIAMLQTLCQAAGLKLHAVTPKLFGMPHAIARSIQPDASPLTPKRLNVVLSVGQRWAELCFFKGDRLLQAQALANGPLLVNEVKRNLAVFKAQYAASVDLEGPDCLYVFGDDAASVQNLQNGQSLPLRLLDPLKQDGASVAEVKNPGQFAGAVGLAALWSHAVERPVNLFTPKRQIAPTSVTRQRGMFYGAAAVLLAVFFIGMTAYILARKRAEITDLMSEKTELESQLVVNAQERADLDAYKEWEQTTIPWLDELYDLTARYPYKEGFRINNLSATTIGSSSAKKNSKDGAVGTIALNGIAPGKKGFEDVHELFSSMARDAHVRATIGDIGASRSDKTPQTFTMKIDIFKQAANRYDTHLVVPPPLIAKKDEAKTPEPDADDGEDQ